LATAELNIPVIFHSAETGEPLPIAKFPDGILSLTTGTNWTQLPKPGQESPFAGRGSFSSIADGNYLIGHELHEGQNYCPEDSRGHEGRLRARLEFSGQTLALTRA